MIRKNCDNCGRFTWRYPSDLKKGRKTFCSNQCHADYKTVEMVEKECEHCSKTFSRRRAAVRYQGIKYCSKKCVGLSQRQADSLECIVCNKIFYVSPSHRKSGKNGRKYCSYSCKHEDGRETRICKNCGDDFNIIKGRPNKFCSKKCNIEHQWNIGTYNVKYPNTLKVRQRIQRKNYLKKAVKNLYNWYCADKLAKQVDYNIPFKDIPQELIELKRLNIKRKRIIKNHNQKQ